MAEETDVKKLAARVRDLEEALRILGDKLLHVTAEATVLKYLLIKHGMLRDGEVEEGVEKAKKLLVERKIRELDPEWLLRFLVSSDPESVQ
jgi:hypothetical protein